MPTDTENIERVTVTVSLSADLVAFAKSKADEIAKRDHCPANVSAFIAALLTKEKRRNVKS